MLIRFMQAPRWLSPLLTYAADVRADLPEIYEYDIDTAQRCNSVGADLRRTASRFIYLMKMMTPLTLPVSRGCCSIYTVGERQTTP